MKKHYLAVALFSALSLSSAANALVPSLDGNFSGSLEFSGKIFEDAPHWLWAITDEAKSELGNIELVKTDGVVVDANTEFQFLEEALVIFHGHLDRALQRGGPGLTPEVKFNNTLYNNPGSGYMNIDLDIKDVTGGKLVLSVAGAGATAHTSADGTLNRTPDGSGISTDRAINLIKQVPGFSPTYDAVTNGSGVSAFLGGIDSTLANNTFTNMIQARAFHLRTEETKLVLPTENMPSTWSATLPITVSLK